MAGKWKKEFWYGFTQTCIGCTNAHSLCYACTSKVKLTALQRKLDRPQRKTVAALFLEKIFLIEPRLVTTTIQWRYITLKNVYNLVRCLEMKRPILYCSRRLLLVRFWYKRQHFISSINPFPVLVMQSLPSFPKVHWILVKRTWRPATPVTGNWKRMPLFVLLPRIPNLSCQK